MFPEVIKCLGIVIMKCITKRKLESAKVVLLQNVMRKDRPYRKSLS
jgi:hypothetical protein